MFFQAQCGRPNKTVPPNLSALAYDAAIREKVNGDAS